MLQQEGSIVQGYLVPTHWMNLDDFCFQEVLNDIIVEIALEGFKILELDRLICTHCGEKCYKYVNKVGLDIYGQKIDNHDANGELVECPLCKKSVAASRFAPHLEKCLGIGRTGRSKRSNSKISDEIFDPHSGNDKHSHSEMTASEDEIHEETGNKPKKRRKAGKSQKSA